MELGDMITTDRIKLEMTAVNKAEALAELTGLLYDNGVLSDRELFLKDVMEREKAGITGIGNGIAIPHGKSKFVKDTAVAFGRIKEGIAWETVDDLPVKFIVLFAVNEEDKTGVHVKLLSKIARKLASEEVCKRLLNASASGEILEILTDG